MKIQLIFAFLFCWSGACQVGFAACLPAGKANGYRFPVVQKIPNVLVGYDVDHFEAWSQKSNQWRQIAVQIDEINKEGSYVLEEGIPYTKNTGTGVTKSVDEIAFKGTDLGDDFADDKIPQNIRAHFQFIQRLHVCDVNDRYLGTVLVGPTTAVPGSLTWSHRFDRNARTVTTPAYRYVFHAKRPMLIGEVFLKSGGQDVPVFADSTFFMPINPAFWLFPGIKFDESDFDSEIECWRSGPVRTIVAVGAKMRKFFSIVNLHLFSELVFYDDFFQIPTQIEMTFDANKYLDYGSGLAYILRYPTGGKWQVSSNLDQLPDNPSDLEGESGAPRKTAKEHSPNGVFRAWGTRKEGSFLAQVRVDQKAINQVPPPFLVEERMFNQKPWKSGWRWMRDIQGNLGVYLDISQVHKGLYDFSLDLMLSSKPNDSFQDFHRLESSWANVIFK